jgi:co-chaperonin GroES (HSP10)
MPNRRPALQSFVKTSKFGARKPLKGSSKSFYSILHNCSDIYPNVEKFVILHRKTVDMLLTSNNKFKKLLVIGDRVLIRPSRPDEKTSSGLYLPPGVQEKEKVQQGKIIKTGPGYAIPMPVEDEPWKSEEESVKYVPLQAKEGDLAIFLVSGATEVMYEGEKYFIVPQGAILLLEREEDL